MVEALSAAARTDCCRVGVGVGEIEPRQKHVLATRQGSLREADGANAPAGLFCCAPAKQIPISRLEHVFDLYRAAATARFSMLRPGARGAGARLKYSPARPAIPQGASTGAPRSRWNVLCGRGAASGLPGTPEAGRGESNAQTWQSRMIQPSAAPSYGPGPALAS
jgi:hypothetical protein